LLVACAAIAAFSFVRMDVTIARHFWNAGRFVRPLGQGLGATVLLSAESAVILIIVLARLARGHISVFAETLVIACLASMCAYGVNDHVLKVFFGVPNPLEVMHGSRHAFNLWMGLGDSSFPSGHMALAAAFAGVFMRLYKASVWPLCALLLVAVAVLLIGDWHFLSDLIAGSFLGLSAGILAGEGWAAHLSRTRET
jgi:membrane-associated phospholipid phosphatase